MTDIEHDGPIIELDVGKIQGLTVNLNLLHQIEIFYGVPFAEPPIGKNRFERTVPLKKWKGTKQTTKPGPFCYPISDQRDSLHHSEDCLYLNVFRPAKINESLPILFIVHGGAYEEGNSARYANIEEIGWKFVAKDIIVVAIQYRLGVFGFASSGSEDMPGNLGYWDQVEALKFVHRNAKVFGGHPNKITLYGSSAGSSSVQALSISPHSRDYVHQVIGMPASGSLFAAWTTSDNVIENTKQLVHAINGDSCESIKECLKKASVKEIYDGLNKIGTTSFSANFVKFGPRLDDLFFPDDYPALIRETKPKPIIIGCAEEESLLWTLVHENNSATAGFTINLEDRKYFSEENIRNMLKEIFPYEIFDDTEEIQGHVLNFYLNDEKHPEKYFILYLLKYTQIFSDIQFNIPVVWDILLRTKQNWKVFAYKSAYVNPGAIPESCPIKSAFHGSDQRYLLLGKDQKHYFDMNEDDKKMEKLIVDAFVSFIKTGSPKNENFDWQPTSQSNPAYYAELKPKPEMKSNLFMDRVKFWTNLPERITADNDPVRFRPFSQDKTILDIVNEVK